VHEDAPVVFQTRWTLSYLRGPLTREQIKVLMDPVRAGTPEMPAEASTPRVAARAVSGAARPVFPPDVPQVFVPLRSAQPAGSSLVYQPMLLGAAQVYYRDPKAGVDTQDKKCLAVALGDHAIIEWSSAEDLGVAETDLGKTPEAEATFVSPPSQASQVKSYEAWKKGFADTLFRTAKLDLLQSPSLGQTSKPGENERDFRVRLAQAAREKRDQVTEQLKAKYGPKLAALQDRIRRAEMSKDVQEKQASASKLQTAISFGATILGAVMGRKTFSAGNIGRAATAARGVGRSVKESSDVTRADENVQAIQQQYNDLDAQFKAEADALASKLDPQTEPLATISLRPKKTDISVQLLALAWAPYWKSTAGLSPAWK